MCQLKGRSLWSMLPFLMFTWAFKSIQKSFIVFIEIFNHCETWAKGSHDHVLGQLCALSNCTGKSTVTCTYSSLEEAVRRHSGWEEAQMFSDRKTYKNCIKLFEKSNYENYETLKPCRNRMKLKWWQRKLNNHQEWCWEIKLCFGEDRTGSNFLLASREAANPGKKIPKIDCI